MTTSDRQRTHATGVNTSRTASFMWGGRFLESRKGLLESRRRLLTSRTGFLTSRKRLLAGRKGFPTGRKGLLAANLQVLDFSEAIVEATASRLAAGASPIARARGNWASAAAR